MRIFIFAVLVACIAPRSRAALFGPVSKAWGAALADARIDLNGPLRAALPLDAPAPAQTANELAISWALENELRLRPEDVARMNVVERNEALGRAATYARNRVKAHAEGLLLESKSLLRGKMDFEKLNRLTAINAELGAASSFSHFFDGPQVPLKEDISALQLYLTELIPVHRLRLARSPVANDRAAALTALNALESSLKSANDSPSSRADEALTALANYAVASPFIEIKIRALRAMMAMAARDDGGRRLRIELAGEIGRSSDNGFLKYQVSRAMWTFSSRAPSHFLAASSERLEAKANELLDRALRLDFKDHQEATRVVWEFIIAAETEATKPGGRPDYILDGLAQFAVACPLRDVKLDALQELRITSTQNLASISLRIGLMEAIGRSSTDPFVKNNARRFIAEFETDESSPGLMYVPPPGEPGLRLFSLGEQKRFALDALRP